MILRRRVSLEPIGGKETQLDDLDDRILISGIDEAAGKDNITAVSVAYRSGQRVTGARRDSLDVTVRFTLNIKNSERQMRQREELLEKVLGWARDGGWLRIGSRPGRKLLVMLATAPGAGDMFNWTNEFTLVFRAYSVPYWMDDAETSLVQKSADGLYYGIEIPGNAETVVDLKIRNSSGKNVDEVTCGVARQMMTFRFPAGKYLGADESLLIDHVQNNSIFYLRARIEHVEGTSTTYRSALLYRSGVDDFITTPGRTRIDFGMKYSGVARGCVCRATVRGRYL